jgi:hypothetical protein
MSLVVHDHIMNRAMSNTNPPAHAVKSDYTLVRDYIPNQETLN